MTIERPALEPLVQRLREPRRFIQVVAGPRQVGKTTLVKQALQKLSDSGAGSPMAQHSVSADGAAGRGKVWLDAQWQVARVKCTQAGHGVLVIDEIQHVPDWTAEVKRLWDEDTASGLDLRVVILGSSPLLIAKGLTESMAGRFELTRLGHWPWSEMCRAFGLTLDQYVFFGGYPGAAPLVNDQKRWASYVMDALVEPTISRDVLMMSPVKKPALLRRLFDLTCTYSGQLLSYQKMLGQLDDAGNTTTLAHYLDLLEGAGMVCGLPKYMGSAVRQRASSPKLQVMNNALMSAYYILQGNSYEQLQQQPNLWGRWVESAVGTHLLTKHLEHSSHHPQIFYWNNGQQEVDYVVSAGKDLWAYEVKSGRQQGQVSGLNGFVKHFKEAKPMIVGTGGLPLGEFMA